jgi:hypothetical protein
MGNIWVRRFKMAVIPTFLQQPVRSIPPFYLPLDWAVGWVLLGAGILHTLMGLLAAIVAWRKGRQLVVWLPIGIIVGTPALLMAITMPSRQGS